jgi:hypothetical protein
MLRVLSSIPSSPPSVTKQLFLIIVLAFGFCFFPSRAEATIAFVQSKSNDGGTVATDSIAFTSNNTAGNTIIVAVRQGFLANPTPVTITDTRGNTYYEVASQDSTNDHRDKIFAAYNIASGANTVTCTYANNVANTMRWAIHEFSGIQVRGAVDKTAGNTGSSTTLDSGNIVTAQANALIFGMATTNSNATITKGASYTLGESNTKITTEYKIVSSTGTYSADFSSAPSDTWAAAIAAFKESDGLQGWWRLDEGSGNNALDSSGNGTTGALTNSPTWITGKRGGALTFASASSQYVDVGNNTHTNLSTAGTVMAWAKPGATQSTWVGIVCNDDLDNDLNGYCLFIRGDSGHFGLHVAPAAGAYCEIQSAASYLDDAWHHVAMTWDASNYILYVDGKIVNSASGACTAASGTYSLKIGASGNLGQYFSGSVDDVRIFNRALSASEVQGFYYSAAGRNGVVRNGKMNL